MTELEQIRDSIKSIADAQQAIRLDVQRVADDLKARPSAAEEQVLLAEHNSRKAFLCGVPSFWRGVLAASLATVFGNGALLLFGWMLVVYVKTH